MKRLFLQLLLFVCAISSVSAQYNIQGKVLDKENDGAIEMATVRLLRAKDSVFVDGVVTDMAGRYTINHLQNGKYLLEYKYLGYKTLYNPLEVKGKSLILKNVYLEEDAQSLKAAEISGTAAQMIVKGDTVEYNASAFKLQENAVVEDLLKRLPGFMIDANGNITVDNETIARIRVDGKRFFDGDIEMVTKNLTADMIDKIQVIDEKSEMAQLTGIEDGETQRIINLKLKPDRNKGTFGNLGGGLGSDFDKGFKDYFRDNYGRDYNPAAESYKNPFDYFMANDARYNANTMINYFKSDRRTTFTAGANNTNNSRSSRGAGNRGWSGGSGITNTFNFGANRNQEFFGDSLETSGNVTYNHSTNYGRSSSKTESWLRDVYSTDSSYNESHSKSNNANLGGEMRWKMTPENTLVFQPSITYGYNSTYSSRTFEYYTNEEATSWGDSHNDNGSQNINARLNLLYSHRSLARRGRVLTGNLSGSIADTKGDGHNVSNKYMPGDSSILLNQYNENLSTSHSLSFRGSYVEPLWDVYNTVEFSAQASYSKRYSQRDQWDWNDETQAFDLYNYEYSNEFWNTSMSENFSLKYNFRDSTNTINLTAGFSGQPSQTYSYTLYGDGEIRDIPNSVFNYSPSLLLRYNIKGNRRNYIRVDYQGRSTEPSVNQMQPVKNNTNVMRETVGNPSLLPSFAHTLRMQFSHSNPESLASFSTSLNGSITQNAMVSNSIYDASGKQYNQTVNADSNPFNVSASVMYNRPIIKNRLHLNTNTQGSYQQRIGYSSRNVSLEEINSNDILDGKLMLGDRSLTDNYSVSENLSLTFTHDVIEVGARGNFRYSNTLNNLNTDIRRSTINWSTSGNVTLHLPFDINIDNNLSFSARQGYAGFDKNELLWNFSFNKPVFKKKFTLQLSANDILRQRLNINQNIGDNSVSYSQSDILSSYFMLTLTYRVRRFGGPRGGRGGMQRPMMAQTAEIPEAGQSDEPGTSFNPPSLDALQQSSDNAANSNRSNFQGTQGGNRGGQNTQSGQGGQGTNRGGQGGFGGGNFGGGGFGGGRGF